MDASLFAAFCDIAHSRAGICLKPGKEALVTTRVAKRLRALGLTSERDYLRLLEADETGDELVQFLDAISTNFTSFFREPDHFELLQESARGWIAAGCRRLRFWSAASSSGEEPYTMAVCLAEAAGDRDVDYRILATDISSEVLARARAGVYDEEAVAPVPRALRAKYFVRQRWGTAPTSFEVAPRLKERVVFKRLNLSSPPFPMSGPLDAVFCRNVMIYFDRPVRQALIAEAERLLKPGGLLLIGHSETLTGLRTALKTVTPSVYVKPETNP